MHRVELIGLLGTGACAIASGAPVVFTATDVNVGGVGRLAAWPNSQIAANAFASNLTNIQIDSFETAPANSTNPTLHFGVLTAAVTNGVVRSVPPGMTDADGRYPISGANYMAADQATMNMAFSQPINAFGFWGIDIGDFGGTLTINLLGGGTRQFSIAPLSGNGSTSGSVLFWGVIDATTAFTGVTFTNNTGITDVFAFDDITVGTLAVPLPSAFALGAAGLAAVAGRVRRRR